MYVIIDGKVYDPEKTPIGIGFKDDQDRLHVIKHLTSMESKPGPRLYATFNDNLPMEQRRYILGDMVERLKEEIATSTG